MPSHKKHLFLSNLLICAFLLQPLFLSGKPQSEKMVQKKVVLWKPTFSSEITFSSKEQVRQNSGIMDVTTDANMAALENYFDRASNKMANRKDIRTLEYVEGGDKYGVDLVKVRYQDGWGFDVTLDPSCLEVILKPFTTDQLDRSFEERIQNDIFDVMESIGLTPRVDGYDYGGGHIHAGMESTFGIDNVRLFRNQVVDFANHPELAMGAMENAPDDAKSFLLMKKEQREALHRWVLQVDAGHFNSVRKAATVLVNDVFLEGKPATAERILKAKYWALNFLRMGHLNTWDTLKPNESWTDYMVWMAFDEVERKARTLEYRPVRSPKNALELSKNIRLIEARLKYLNEIDKDIPLHPKFIEGTHPTTKEKVEMFYKWIAATGLNPREYQYLLPENSDQMSDFKDWHIYFNELIERSTLKENNRKIVVHRENDQKIYCDSLFSKVSKNKKLPNSRVPHLSI